MKTKLMKFATVAVLGMFAVVALPGFALSAPTPTPTPVPEKNVADATYGSIALFTSGTLKINTETGGRNWDAVENVNKAIADNDGVTAGEGNDFAEVTTP